MSKPRKANVVLFLAALLLLGACGPTTPDQAPASPTPTQPAPTATKPPPSPTAIPRPNPTHTPQPIRPPEDLRDLPPFSAASAAALFEVNTLISTDPVTGLAFVPEQGGYSLWAAVWGAPSRLEHWDHYSGELVEAISPAEFLAPGSLSASDDGQFLATTSECCVELWDTTHGRLGFDFEMSPWLEEALIAPAGVPILAVAYSSPDGTVVLVDWDSGDTLEVFRHGEYVNDIDFSSDGRYLASGAFNGTVKVIALEELAETFPYDLGGEVSALALEGSPPGAGALGHLLATAVEGEIILWDGAIGEELRRLPGHSARIESMDFSPNGEVLASGDREGNMILWNTLTGEVIVTLDLGDAEITQLLFSPDGSLLATATVDGRVMVWATVD